MTFSRVFRQLWRGLPVCLLASLPAVANPTSVKLCEEAKTQAANGHPDAALAAFTRALQADPQDIHAYCGRASALRQQGRLDQALADISKARALNPMYAPVYYNRAVIEGQQGKLDDALADYSRAIELDPKVAASYYGRADIRKVKGDFTGASADQAAAAKIEIDDVGTLPGFASDIPTVNGVGQKLVPAEPHVGERMKFTIRLKDMEGAHPSLPPMDGLRNDGTSTESSQTLINGVTLSSTTFTFVLTPERPGDFTIPASEVHTANGRLVAIPAFSFHVTDSPLNSPKQTASVPSPAPASNPVLPGFD